jgi:hypothetical protein
MPIITLKYIYFDVHLTHALARHHQVESKMRKALCKQNKHIRFEKRFKPAAGASSQSG